LITALELAENVADVLGGGGPGGQRRGQQGGAGS
jgi:hypothetical protein